MPIFFASYPFKKKVKLELIMVIKENPYESKIPTRFLLGMIDADSYIGNWRKNPPQFPAL